MMSEVVVKKSFISQKFRNTTENYFFILPALAIFSVFWIYPFYDVFRLSLHEWRGIGPETFVGLRNFSELFTNTITFFLLISYQTSNYKSA